MFSGEIWERLFYCCLSAAFSNQWMQVSPGVVGGDWVYFPRAGKVKAFLADSSAFEDAVPVPPAATAPAKDERSQEQTEESDEDNRSASFN